MLGDRERIARELHDVVIQRLFAAGMKLQTANQFGGKPEQRKRIDVVIDDLDATIRDIRGAIFELRQAGAGSLRGEIRALVEQARAPLGFRVELRLDGPLDSAVPDTVRPALLAVLREALSNVARHAAAATVSVGVTVDEQEVRLSVVDDGCGVEASGPPSGGDGLRNMRARADALGGICGLAPAVPRGTALTWSVPV